jgi:hypothetical protein
MTMIINLVLPTVMEVVVVVVVQVEVSHHHHHHNQYYHPIMFMQARHSKVVIKSHSILGIYSKMLVKKPELVERCLV